MILPYLKMLTAQFKLEKGAQLPWNMHNNQRYHESLNNVTPADVYFGRDQEILARREIIKQQTLLKRRLDFEVQKTTLI